MQDIVLLAVHGMGPTSDNFAEPVFSALRNAMGDAFSGVHTASVFYQPILNENQERLFDAMKKRELDCHRARKFLLQGLSTGSCLNRNIEEKGGVYQQAQEVLYSALDKLFEIYGDLPVVLLSHSSGCDLVSNYIWDAQKPGCNHGVWRDGGPGNVHKGSKKDLFLRLKTLRHWYTLGANKPLHTAGMSRDQIQSVKTSTCGYNFRWKNFYHPNDIFAWPLKPLSPSYNQSVYKDLETVTLDQWTESDAAWQLGVHNSYWTSETVVESLLEDIAVLRGGSRVEQARAQAV